MKRARGKNTYNRYDDIDVPEIVGKNYERHLSEVKNRTKKAEPVKNTRKTSTTKTGTSHAKTSSKTNNRAVNKTVSTSRRKNATKKKKNKLSKELSNMKLAKRHYF